MLGILPQSTPKRHCRGASLIETSLTAGIMVFVIGLIISVYSEAVFRRGLQAEAYEVSVLARAAKSHVLTDLQGSLDDIRVAPGRILTIPIDDLVARGHYPSTAPRITSRKRALSVFLWAETDKANSPVLVMAQAQFPTGRSGRVGVPRGHALVTSAGWVAPHAPTEIQGPGLLFQDVAILQNAGRTILPGDLFAFEYISAGRDASPYLHRLEQVSSTLNQMDTDLDLNNNNIVGVNNISAENIDIEAGLTAHALIGDVTFQGQMTVEADMSITGNATIGGNINVAGTTTTEALSVTGTILAQTIDVLETATFHSLAAANLTTRTSLTAAQLTVELFNADAVTGTTADVEVLTANQMIIEGRVTSEEVFTKTLKTGSCVGC